MVLCLDAGNRESYPGSGTAWNDLSVNGNNSTLFSSPPYVSANLGYFTFNGSTQYVENSTPNTGITGNASVTLSCWFYPTSTTPSSFQALLGYGGTAGAAGDTFAIGINATTFNFSMEFNGGNNVTSNINAYVPNTTWYNITVTKTPGAANTTTRLYLNGQPQSIASASSVTPNVLSGVVRIARWTFTSLPYYFAGRVSNAMVYNRALSAAEVSQNFSALRGRFGV
jgi:hypothetical protein